MFIYKLVHMYKANKSSGQLVKKKLNNDNTLTSNFK